MSKTLVEGAGLVCIAVYIVRRSLMSGGAVMTARFGYLHRYSRYHAVLLFKALPTVPKGILIPKTTPPLQTPSPNFPHPSPSPPISESPRTAHRSDLSFQLALCTVTHARPSASSPTRITRRRSRLKHGERKHATEAKLHPPVCGTSQCFSCENDGGDVHASILLVRTLHSEHVGRVNGCTAARGHVSGVRVWCDVRWLRTRDGGGKGWWK
jgi:hypothetical protein